MKRRLWHLAFGEGAILRRNRTDDLPEAIEIEIYRLEDGDGWTLELIDAEGGSIVWEEQFATDIAAFAEFTERLEELGLERLIEPNEDQTATVH